MVGAPLKAEISFPAAVFANVPALSCSGVVSLNFSHSLMLEACAAASGAQQAGNPLCDLTRNPSRDGSRLLGAALPGQTNSATGACRDPSVPVIQQENSCNSGPSSLPQLCLARWKCCSIKPSHLPQAWDGGESPGKRLVAWQSCSGRRKAPHSVVLESRVIYSPLSSGLARRSHSRPSPFLEFSMECSLPSHNGRLWMSDLFRCSKFFAFS